AFAIHIRITKMRIQIRLIENCIQLTKFQIFQRAIVDFNGTAMKAYNRQEKPSKPYSFLLYLHNSL
ncbi:hypothetical protein, partial [Anaerorudis cellulosivorans]|uniref:hypothetical protein n=1 Tax=Anaerorudis cellulosivorans TaxID=3397862 RepID=UPI00221F9B43